MWVTRNREESKKVEVEPGFGSCVPVGRQRDSWNLVLALATPTLENHWLVLQAVGLGLRAQCPGSSRAGHSTTTPRHFLVFWAQDSGRLQTTQRTYPGLDLTPQRVSSPGPLF